MASSAPQWLVALLVGTAIGCGAAPPGEPEEAPRLPPVPDSALPAETAPPELSPEAPALSREEFKALSKAAPNALPAKQLAQPAEEELRLHFLDVGQGDSTLIECPGGERILVDGGSGTAATSRPENARRHLMTTLGAKAIDTVIVSHPDRDHYNALPYLLEDVTIGHIQVVGPEDEYSGPFTQWLATFPDSQKTRITEEFHDSVDSPNGTMDCGAATVHVLSVAATGASDNSPKNSLSMVLMVSYGDFDAILTADATFVTENKILGWYPAWWLDAELLKLGHHGSSTTSSAEVWVTTTAPEIAVVSAAHDNMHGHPRRVVVERIAEKTLMAEAHPFRWYASQTQAEELSEYNEAIYGTGSSGTVVVGSDGTNYWVQRER